MSDISAGPWTTHWESIETHSGKHISNWIVRDSNQNTICRVFPANGDDGRIGGEAHANARAIALMHETLAALDQADEALGMWSCGDDDESTKQELLSAEGAVGDILFKLRGGEE